MNAAVWRKGKTMQLKGMKEEKISGCMLTGSSGTVLLDNQQRSFHNRICID